VAAQLLNHPVPVDPTVVRMMQHVHADESAEESLEGLIE
jgi:succinate dehydrogenase/fumarate reductase flavoprotein subunit